MPTDKKTEAATKPATPPTLAEQCCYPACTNPPASTIVTRKAFTDRRGEERRITVEWGICLQHRGSIVATNAAKQHAMNRAVQKASQAPSREGQPPS